MRRLLKPDNVFNLGILSRIAATLLITRVSSENNQLVPSPAQEEIPDILTFLGRRLTFPEQIYSDKGHTIANNHLYSVKYDEEFGYLSVYEPSDSKGRIIPLESFPSFKREGYKLAILMAHGGIKNGELKVDLFKPFHDEENDLVEQLATLQKRTGITNFYILSCYCGALINYIKLLDLATLQSFGFAPQTQIITFGNHNSESLTTLLFAVIQRTIDQQKITENYSELAAKLSLEFGITTKCLTIDQGSLKEVKHNLHKYPQVWARLKNKQLFLTEKESVELIVLQEQKKAFGFLPEEQQKRLKVLIESKNLYELYKNNSDQIAESFPNVAFIESVGRGKIAIAREWLQTGMVNINHPGYGVPVFIVATVRDKGVEVMDFLLQNGANIDAVDPTGDTALAHAVVYKRYEVAKFFLENGANPNIKNQERKSVFDLETSDQIEKLLIPFRALQKVFDEIPDLKGKIIVRLYTKNPNPAKILLSSVNPENKALDLIEAAAKKIDKLSPIYPMLDKILSDARKDLKGDNDDRKIKTNLTFSEAQILMGRPHSKLVSQFAKIVGNSNYQQVV